MRHVLIAAGLLLASLLVVQVVVAALQISATRGHEVSDNFVPGELPRSALPAVLGPTVRARATTGPDRVHPAEPRASAPLDYRQRVAPEPQVKEPQNTGPLKRTAPDVFDSAPRQPAAQEIAPRPTGAGAPPSLKLPTPPVRNTAPPGADRA
jgi:hypothetical protein